MQRPFAALARLTSGKTSAKLVVLVWILAAGIMSGVGDMARNHAVDTSGGDLPQNAPAMVAEATAKAAFGQTQGLPALITFSRTGGLTPQDLAAIAQGNQALADKAQFPSVQSTLPQAVLAAPAPSGLLSHDGTTFMLPVTLREGLAMEEVHSAVKRLDAVFAAHIDPAVDVHVTGPAGIASDAIETFANADLVLLFATILLVVVLLVLIYRSPLLVLIPLVAVGIAYQVIDRTLGMLAAGGHLVIETQSLSIMTILLFAAVTDYAMFVLARFREELKRHESKHVAMEAAMRRVGEPIFFSGGTVIAALLILLCARFGTYHNFGAVFSIAMVIILLAGLTLVPTLFTLFGRRAFWPFVPRVGDPVITPGAYWSRLGAFVTRRPRVLGLIALVVLIGLAANIGSMRYTFNLLDSFPAASASRLGFELLGRKYAPGDLAPTQVVVASRDAAFGATQLRALAARLAEDPAVASVRLGPNPQFAETPDGRRVAAFDLTLKSGPYSAAALNALDALRTNEKALLDASGLAADTSEVLFAGETAKAADSRAINQSDTRLVVVLVALVLAIMLGFQTRSVIAPLYMMGSILLSYTAALGLAVFVFQHAFGYAAVSYRMPLYAFVFLVALGVDYSIMLMSRIREELAGYDTAQAVQRAVSRTGGVISSAGVILAATFAVLMTQSMRLLFTFGFVMAVGILLDTFLVRGVLVPAIVTVLDRWSFGWGSAPAIVADAERRA